MILLIENRNLKWLTVSLVAWIAESPTVIILLTRIRRSFLICPKLFLRIPRIERQLLEQLACPWTHTYPVSTPRDQINFTSRKQSIWSEALKASQFEKMISKFYLLRGSRLRIGFIKRLLIKETQIELIVSSSDCRGRAVSLVIISLVFCQSSQASSVWKRSFDLVRCSRKWRKLICIISQVDYFRFK